MPERISSPEQLHNYIRVTNTGAWIILSSIIIFILGFFYWIFNGRLEISFQDYVYTDENNSFAFLTIDKVLSVKKGMNVRISGLEDSGSVESISEKTEPYENIVNQIGYKTAELIGLTERSRVFKVSISLKNAPRNLSRGVFIIDTVAPYSLLFKE